MKKKLIVIFAVSLLFACNDDSKNGTTNSLEEQKDAIEKQIDSLHHVLTKIEKQLQSENSDKSFFEIDGVKIENKAFAHYIELQGSIDTDGNVMLIPEAMGKVIKIYKKEGDKVRKGETVMLLDQSVLKNQLSEVQTQYNLAKTAFERQKRLWEQKIGSEMAYLQAKTQKESLYKKLVTLRTQMGKYKVKSPISGTIDELMIKEGEMANPQRPAARIVNLNNVYMQADVSEKYLAKIKQGKEAIVYFPELNKKIRSTVSTVGNFIHPNNRTFKIRIDLLNLDGDLKPNLTGNIKIKDYETDNAVVLPLSLIQEDRKGNNYVFVLEPTDEDIYEVKKREVKLGISYKDKVIVKEGLQAGEIIAGLSARGLTEGDKVKLSNPEIKQITINNIEKKKTHKYHIVKKGETLYRIHKKHNVSLDSLRHWNELKNDNLNVGQKLRIR
jgi:RND family efflux transporter MFP subunit